MANVYVRSAFTAVSRSDRFYLSVGISVLLLLKRIPELLRSDNMTPDQLVEAMRLNNQVAPSGQCKDRRQKLYYPCQYYAGTCKDFENIPLFKDGVQNLYLRDVATVEDGADVTTSYAWINGKRVGYTLVSPRVPMPLLGRWCKTKRKRCLKCRPSFPMM